jgi:hypothetical protein
MRPLLLLLPPTALAQLPAGPPFADGAAQLMGGKSCEWQTDVSGHHPIGPGLAGGVDSLAQASATACEKWCCDTSHMKTVKATPPNAPWKFTEEAAGEVPRQCESVHKQYALRSVVYGSIERDCLWLQLLGVEGRPRSGHVDEGLLGGASTQAVCRCLRVVVLF